MEGNLSFNRTMACKGILNFIQQAFGSSGGKSKIAKEIVAMMPPHRTYVEPFAGGAAVFWQKPKGGLEVLNDIDTEIAFAYKFIRDCTAEQLSRLSQKDWVISKKTWQAVSKMESKSDVDRFYKFFYVHVLSYGKKGLKAGFGQYANEGKTLAIVKRLPKLRDRLQGVKIYSQDYKKVMEIYDRPNTFFYLDPPYKGTVGGRFQGMQIDEQEFSKLIHSVKGKVLASYKEGTEKMFRGFATRKIKVPQLMDVGPLKGHWRYELIASNYHKTKKEETPEKEEQEEGTVDEKTENKKDQDYAVTEFITGINVLGNGNIVVNTPLNLLQFGASETLIKNKVPTFVLLTNSQESSIKNLADYKDIAIYTTEDVWNHIVGTDDFVNTIPIDIDDPMTIGGFIVTAFNVNSTDDPNTIGFHIKDGGRSLVYIPNFDSFTEKAKEMMVENDIWFLDGSSKNKMKLSIDLSKKLEPKAVYFINQGKMLKSYEDDITDYAKSSEIDIKILKSGDVVEDKVFGDVNKEEDTQGRHDIMTKEVLNQVFSMTQLNFSKQEIANKIGLSRSTIYKYQKILGL